MLSRTKCIIVVLLTFSLSFLWGTQALTLDQKLGQLFIAAAYSNQADADLEGLNSDFETNVNTLIQDYHIGGLIFKQHWSIGLEMLKAQEYQSKSAIPLFLAQDLEWGLSMRLDNTMRFPKNMTLGAIQNIDLIEAMGREVGRQMRCLGLNYNFAPDVDVNNNPANPVIHLRSFGDNPEEVAKRGVAMMRGLQSSGILACAKHFPGHGDTATDSHEALPQLPFTLERLQAVELYPFQKMIQAGVKSVMVAHLAVPALEKKIDRPASLSKAIVTDLLQNKLGYQGLIVTDDLLMKAIGNSYDPGEACLQAFLAGNDLILTATGAIAGIQRLKQAVLDGEIQEDEIDRRVDKILAAKDWLRQQNPMQGGLFTPEALALKKQLFEEALTLVKNTNNLIPLQDPNLMVAHLQIGEVTPSPFDAALKNLHPATSLFIYSKSDLAPLQDYQTIIVSLLGMNKFSNQNYGLDLGALAAIKSLAERHQVIVIIFGSPYSLGILPETAGVILAYEDDQDAQVGAANALMGNIPFKGKLPVCP